jgi:hypothetical protein
MYDWEIYLLRRHERELALLLADRMPDGSLSKDFDSLKRSYAAAMTAVDPSNLVVMYDAVHECDFMHRGQPLLTLGDEGGGGEGKTGTVFLGPRELLLSKHGEDALLGFGSLSGFDNQEDFVRKMLEAGVNAEPGNDFGGFVVVAGGRETLTGDGVLPKQFGFCHQRCRLTPDQLGDFTRMQAIMMHGPKEADKELHRLLANLGTLAKTGFHEGGELLTLDYARFLVRERGLKDFRVLHVMLYKTRHYLTQFFEMLLQLRHELLKVPNSELSRLLLKLAGNSVYGFGAIEGRNFPRTRIVSESYLKRMKWGDRLSLTGPDVYQVTLMGAVQKPGKRPDLLYAVTSHRPDERISNTIQMSANILGQSRVIFLSKLLFMLRCFDPRKVEVAYHGEL